MAKRGRPRKNTVKLGITLYLDPDLDADLLNWLQELPHGTRARRVIRALRQGGIQTSAETVPEDDEEALEALDNVFEAWNF